MQEEGRRPWTRRDNLTLFGPLVPIALALFLFTQLHTVFGVVLTIHVYFLYFLAAAQGFLVLLLVLRGFRKFTRGWRTIPWLGAALVYGLLSIFAFVAMQILYPPLEAHRRRVEGIGTVAILYYSFLQGQEATLATVLVDTAPLRIYLVKVSIRTDEPRPGSTQIRPENHQEGDDWQIHVAPDGVILGFYRFRLCNLAWDPRTGKRWGVGSSSSSSIEALPLFRLMGPDGSPSARDVDRLVEYAAESARNVEARPDLDDPSYCEALAHPNPAVRTAARRIVDAGGPKVYPEASKFPR